MRNSFIFFGDTISEELEAFVKFSFSKGINQIVRKRKLDEKNENYPLSLATLEMNIPLQ